MRCLWPASRLVLVALLFHCFVLSAVENPLANGFGDQYVWRSWEDGLAEAEESMTPIMLIIHRKGCKASRETREMFAESETLEEKSHRFVMINLFEEDIPEEFEDIVDYYPTIFFLDPYGKLMEDVINNATQWPYFYGDEEEILGGMDKALQVNERRKKKRRRRRLWLYM